MQEHDAGSAVRRPRRPRGDIGAVFAFVQPGGLEENFCQVGPWTLAGTNLRARFRGIVPA